MSRLRARLASSQDDRELHTQLALASKCISKAMEICHRSDKRASQDTNQANGYRKTLSNLKKAERMLDGIGYLKGSATGAQADLENEARELCRWLESRERRSLGLKPLHGKAYAQRLESVKEFLFHRSSDSDDSLRAKVDSEVVSRPPQPDWVLWQRAVELAHAAGEGDNEEYVDSIYHKLRGGNE